MEVHGFISKRTYVLDADHNVVAQPDVMKWGTWLNAAAETGASVIKQEEIGGAYVSTVFLGLDHNHNHRGDGDPVLFETKVFRKDGAEFTRRYKTWAEAEEGHKYLAELAAVTEPIPLGQIAADAEKVAGDITQPLPPDED